MIPPLYKAPDPNRIESYYLAVCGTLYCVYWHKNKIYFGNEIMPVVKPVQKKWRDKNIEQHYESSFAHGTKLKAKFDINTQLNCPVILVSVNNEYYGFRATGDIICTPIALNPRLSDFGIGAVPPEEAWIKISQFLTRF